MKIIYTSVILAGLVAAGAARAETNGNSYGVGNTDYGSSNVANQPNRVPPSTTDMSNSSSDSSGPNSAAYNNGAARPGAPGGVDINSAGPMNNGATMNYGATVGNLYQTDVRGAQQALSKHGFQVSQDGIVGPKTKGAIRQFQAKSGLPETGELDSKTVDALNQPENSGGSSATDQPTGL